MAEDAAARPIEELLTHRRFVRSLAHALVHDPAAAEDVEQETWLRALRSPPAFDAGIRAWLKRVVRSAASDANRRDVRREARESSSAGPEAQPSTADIAARLETERRLVEAVGALDEKYRRVVFLRFFEELPPRAIAKRLECPVATVRTQTARALGQLREQLDRRHEGGRNEWLGALAPLAKVAVSATISKSVVAAAAVLVVAAAVALRSTWSTAPNAPARESASAIATAGADAQVPTTNGNDEIDAGRAADAKPLATTPLIAGTVVGPLREPIAGAEVELQSGSDGSVRQSARTDGVGSFRFETLLPGQWSLRARSRGLLPSQRWIDVDDGESRSELRVTLWGARDLDGDVVDDGGRPIPNARIYAAGGSRIREWPGASATSDVNGEFVLADVPLHPFSVDVFAPGFPPKWHVTAPHAGEAFHVVLDVGDVATIEAQLDERASAADVGTGISINAIPFLDGRDDRERDRSFALVPPARSVDLSELAPGTYEIEAWGRDRGVRVVPSQVELAAGERAVVRVFVDPPAPPRRLTGRVVDAAGAPVASAEFLVSHLTVDRAARRIECDESGRFCFESPWPARRQLYAWPADAERCFEAVDAPGRAARIDSGVDDCVLTLQPCERLDGRVLDSSGAPVAKCDVVLQSGNFHGPELAHARTTAEGAFSCTGRLSGSDLFARIDGEAGERVLRIAPPLRESEHRTEVILRVGRLATVRGRVVDEDGAPIAGAWLRASREPELPMFRSEWSLNGVPHAVTDDAGRFVLDRLGPEARSVYVGLDPTSVVSVVAIPIALADGETRDGIEWVLPLRRAAPRFVRVRVRWDDGEPEAKALVAVTSTDRVSPKWVDEAGRLVLGPFDEATIRVCAHVDRKTPEGLFLAHTPVTDVAVGGPEQELVLPRRRMGRAIAHLPASISTDDLAGLRISVQHRTADDGWSGSSDVPYSFDGGALAIGPLTAARYREIYFNAPNLRTAWIEAAIPPDGVVDLGTLPLERLPETALTIIDRSGHPLAGAELLVNAKWSHLDGYVINTREPQLTDANGVVRLPGNVHYALIRAPGCAPLEWCRRSDAAEVITLLPSGILELRDLPIEPGTRQPMWMYEVELRSDESGHGTYDRLPLGGGSGGWKNGSRLEGLPAGPVTIHFFRMDGDYAIHRPEAPRDGVYYRVDATVIAGTVVPVSIAPKH